MIFKKGLYIIKRNKSSGHYITGKLVKPIYTEDSDDHWLIEVVQNNGYGIKISNDTARIICPTKHQCYVIEVYDSYAELMAKIL